MSLIDTLDEDEVEVFKEVIEEVRQQKIDLRESKQIREIEPIESWVESPYYVGRDGQQLYDFWKEHLIDVFSDNGRDYNEVIVTGSIGGGKSTFSLFAMLRKIYELSCYENIAALFNLMSTSMIVFIYFSVNRTQAELTGFGQFKSLLDSIPYFKENFKRNENLNSVIQLPENLLFTHGSKGEHAIGMNLIGSILDEANFFKGEEQNPNRKAKETYSRVADLYSGIVNRAKSRFMSQGEDHSLSILVSSATHSSSFTQKRIEKMADEPTTKIIKARLWDAKPDDYTDEKFTVFIGSETLDPYIVDSIVDVNEFLESVGENTVQKDKSVEYALSKVPEAYKDYFQKIPTDFRDRFEDDLIRSLQDIGGVSVAPTGRLFTNKPVFRKVIEIGENDGLKHPFYKSEFEISTGTDKRIEDYLRKGFIFQNRDKPRFLHIDQSTTTDSTGIAMCHIDKIEEDGDVSKPYVKVDFMLRINPPDPPKEISISKIRDFVFYLRDEMDLSIAKVSYDWFACLSEGHKVNTRKGIINIENISEGDEVLTQKGYKEVTNTFNYKDAPVLNIITKSGRYIEGTLNHKIKVLKEWDYTNKRTPIWEWKKFSDIEVDDIVYIEILEDEKKIYDKVVEIEEGISDVYDIEVEDENAYYVNGFYSHNSQESRQVLNESGIEADHRSIDRTDEYYLTLVRLIYEERIYLYNYKIFENELFDLIHDRAKRKVDHPIEGSKDVSDAVSGAVANALDEDMVESSGDSDVSVLSEVNKGGAVNDVDEMMNNLVNDLMGNKF